jgi:hypothetical protein
LKQSICILCLLFIIPLAANDSAETEFTPVRLVIKSTIENSPITFSVTLYSNDNQTTYFTVQDTSFTLDLQMDSFTRTIDKKSGEGQLKVVSSMWYHEQWNTNLSAIADSIVFDQYSNGAMSVETYEHKSARP